MKHSKLFPWVGSKKSIGKSFLSFVPPNFNSYFEPFLGSGYVFFLLAQNHIGTEYYLSDINPFLINFYSVLRDNPDYLIKRVGEVPPDKQTFLEYRKMLGTEETAEEMAFRFYYLITNSYRGLWRTNKKGELNMSYMGRKNKNYKETIYFYSVLLRQAQLRTCNYIENEKLISSGDWVYLDPPYLQAYTGYTDDEFNGEKHSELIEFVQRLNDKGAFITISSSSNNVSEELYDTLGFNKEKIWVKNTIYNKNNSPSYREEIIYRNY